MSEASTRNAVYVGSFDPPTLGHLDIIQRGARLFDRLTVGIGINPDKKPLFSPDERIALVGDILCFEGLSVTFAREIDAAVLLRGVRTVSDIELEFTMALTNHSLAPELETVFLMANEKYSHISSTLIKQIARMGQDLADSSLHRFVPECVVEPLLDRYRTIG
jgi:pantetheine-phosphate adenylyltransferase